MDEEQRGFLIEVLNRLEGYINNNPAIDKEDFEHQSTMFDLLRAKRLLEDIENNV